MWKDIKGHEGLYQVSSDGQIRSYKKIKGIWQTLKWNIGKDGYARLHIGRGSTRKRMFVHRLVAETFLAKDTSRPFVNHKNGIKTDNRVENLEWCTRKENSQHAFKLGLNIGRKGEDHINISVLTEEQVLEIREMYKTGNYIQTELAEIFKVKQAHISSIVLRKVWKHI